MGSLFDKENTVLDRRDSLEAVPVINDGANLITQDDGRILIRIPSGGARGLVARLLPALPDRQVRLDQLGSFVLSHVDGKNTVLQIIRSFVTEFRVNRREAEQSVVEFLKSLTQRRIVSLVIK